MSANVTFDAYILFTLLAVASIGSIYFAGRIAEHRGRRFKIWAWMAVMIGVELLRRSSAARRRRSRLLPGDHLLSDALVSDRLSRPHRRLVHVRDTDLDRYRGADLRPDARP